MTVTQTITIQAPIDRVFSTFTNLDRAAETLSGITSLQLLEGPAQMAIGTKWSETREMMGKESTEVMWVTALTPNQSYAVDAESHGTKYHSEFTFAEGDGGTEVTWMFQGIPQSTFAKLMSLMAFLFMGSLKKMMLQDLQDLKAACKA